MKGLFSPRQRFVILALCVALGNLSAADLKEARVTAVIKDVKLLPGQAEPRAATVNDTVTHDTAVRTGVDSRSELTFDDLTIARLGANTIFSFDKGTRTVELGGGAILLRVPKNSGGAKISTAAVTAAITGTTMMAEYHSNSYYKFIMLEGTSRICLPQDAHVKPDQNAVPGQCVDIGPGQMLIGRPGEPLGKAVDVDLKKLVKSSQLTHGFGPLGSEDLIDQAILAQLDRSAISTVPIEHDVIDQKTAASTPTPTPAETPTPTPEPTPTPTPSKFGALNTITSSNLSTIDSGTVITTDPSITRNGETDFGKIYRGPEQDGSASAYFFTATSAFDTASGFDGQFVHEGDVPIAAFKFLSLIIAGNPTISTDNGGALNLALISVGDITSTEPGGTLTFAGIEKLLLATQNGSITLGPELSFEGFSGLFFHARGEGSNVILGSSFDVGELRVDAEGSIQLNGEAFADKFHAFAGTDFLAGDGVITTGHIDITALNNINFSSSQFSAAFGNIDVLLNAANALNIDPTGGDQSVFRQAGTFSAFGKTINLLTDDETFTIQFNPAATLTRFTAGIGGIHGPDVGFAATNLELFSGGDIHIYGTQTIPGEHGTIGGTIMAAGLFNAQSDVFIGNLTAGTSIFVGSDLDGGNFTAGTTITVVEILAGFGTATAGGDISAGRTAIVAITSPNGVLRVAGGIHPFVSLGYPFVLPEGANLQHTITINSIVSPAGIDFSGNQFGGISGLSSGGLLTINATTLRFDSEDGIGDVNFNGADANAFFGTTPAGGGDGGVFKAFTTGDISVGSYISATTGLNDPESEIEFSGKGGTVELDSSHGMISVDSTILVSSNDSGDGSPRRSASGGNITIHSGLTNGTAITLDSESQLLSFLNDSAPGPGGAITITSDGGDIFANGQIIADRGTITISNQNEMSGGISLNGLPPAPLVSLGNGSYFSSEFLNVSSSGDIEIGEEVAFNSVTISLSALRNISGADFISAFSGESETVFVSHSTGNVSLLASGSISLSSIEISRTNDGVSDGLNVTVSAGMDLEISGQLHLQTDPSSLTSGGNIMVTSGRDFSIGGNLFASAFVHNDANSGANITLTSGGSMGAFAFSLQTGVSGGVSLQSGANITVDSVGDINITGPDGNGFLAAVQNFNSHITNGGNIFVRSSNGSILEAPEYSLTVLNIALDTINTGGNITVNAHNDFKTANNGQNGMMHFQIVSPGGEIGTGGNISVTVGNVLAAEDVFASVDMRHGGSILNGGTITFQIGSAMQVQDSAGFVIARDPLDFRSVNEVASVNLININTASISVLGNRFDAYVDDSGGGDEVPSGFFTASVNANSQINVAGVLNVLGTVHANGPIIAGTLSSTNVSATGTGSSVQVGIGGIQPFSIAEGLRSDLPHFISAPLITSTGGIDFNGEDGGGFTAGRSGKNLTVNTQSISFGSSDDFRTNGPVTMSPGDISGSVTFNGGAGGGLDQFENQLGGGDGGTFVVNASSDITVNSAIEATTGLQPQNFAPSGNGGTVELNSDSGTVTVNGRIQVSSNDAPTATPSPPPRRRSARGGNITLKSGKAGANINNRAIAINVTSSAQLLSLLAAAPTPRPGGKVTILATGANSDVNINAAKIQADGGTIDIRHTGDGGRVTISGVPGGGGIAPNGFVAPPSQLSADVIKAGVFGANGSLSIGNSTLSGDTLIRLYAPSSNGELIFVANTTLSSGGRIDLAANTITINPRVVVTITGNAGQANVYTNNPNYSGSGGNNPNNGSFSGNGAHNPLPLSSAPPFDSAPSHPTGIGSPPNRGNGR